MSESAVSAADTLRDAVRRKYADLATGSEAGCCGPDAGCDADASEEVTMIGDAYEGVDGYVASPRSSPTSNRASTSSISVRVPGSTPSWPAGPWATTGTSWGST